MGISRSTGDDCLRFKRWREKTGKGGRMEPRRLRRRLRCRCWEDKWRLKVEINSLENDTELLLGEKIWNDAEIQQGNSRFSQRETSVTQPGHTCKHPGRCIGTFTRIPTLQMRSVFQGKFNVLIKAISQHVRWRIGGWRNRKKSRLSKLTAGALGKSSNLRKSNMFRTDTISLFAALDCESWVK